jgi:xanthine phosphoribosyltransferase
VVVSGFGIVIEKVFQGGGDWLRSQDYLVESLVKITSLESETIEMS